jgi:hypothetical protein
LDLFRHWLGRIFHEVYVSVIGLWLFTGIHFQPWVLFLHTIRFLATRPTTIAVAFDNGFLDGTAADEIYHEDDERVVEAQTGITRHTWPAEMKKSRNWRKGTRWLGDDGDSVGRFDICFLCIPCASSLHRTMAKMAVNLSASSSIPIVSSNGREAGQGRVCGLMSYVNPDFVSAWK